MKTHPAVTTLAFFLSSIWLLGQGISNTPIDLQAVGYDSRASAVPANSATTMLNFTVEGDTAGMNAFDVITSDPGVLVSLILPSGSEVTSANASGLGFTFTIIPEDSTPDDVPSVLSLPGTHTIIEIPGGQPSGLYKIKADATSVSTTSGIIATYFPSSKVRAAASTNANTYKIGDTVVLSAFVFDSTTPITGASISAAVSTPLLLAGQASLGNYQLQNQQTVSQNLVDYTYSVTLTNTGAAVPEVWASLSSRPDNVTVLTDTVPFGDIAANSTTTVNMVIERDPNISFDPSTLQWVLMSPGAVTNVTLQDSGTYDAQTGDGVYNGTFTPTAAGAYTALLSITGTSASGVAFSRAAVVQFDVSAQQLASLGALTDTLSGSGLTTTAAINVVTPGTYRFSMQLQASNQNTITSSASSVLSAGAQQVAATFSSPQIFGLGVDGPYERVNAVLTLLDTNGDKTADYRADAGPTSAYSRSQFAPPLYLTGQNSAAGVITGGGSTFDLLRVTIGISSTTAGTCSWGGILTDLAGNVITWSNGTGSVPQGASSVTLDFNGNAIARAANGPYAVTNFSISCDPNHASARTLFQTQGFTASQFTNVALDFTLSVGPPPNGATPGSVFSIPVSISGASGGFTGAVSMNVSGVPSGATSAFKVPVLFTGESYPLSVTTGASTPPGLYALTVSGSSGPLSHSQPVILTITGTAATPVFSVPAGNYSSAQTVTISTTTPGVSIRYTTDGSTPSSSIGLLYSVPVSVSNSMTLKAIAYGGGLTDSAVASAAYTIQPPVATPTFSPAAGIYSSAQTVTISTTTSGASIRYTIDGSTPSETAGTLYTSPVTVSSTTTIKAIAYATSYTDSSVASATYTIQPPVATPAFTPAPGIYASALNVTISTTTSGASIRYTTDGSAPSETAGTLYSTPIPVSSTATIRAIAYATGYTDSSVASATYTILPIVATPVFSPVAGTYTSTQLVTISSTTSGASIRYTTDGSTPTETAGTLYNAPVTVSASTTIKAIAYTAGMTDSSIATATYTITPPQPDFSLSASPGTRFAVQSASATYTVTVTAMNGFTGTVSFVVRGLPDGTTYSAANVVGSGSTSVTITTTATSPVGAWPIQVQGASGSLQHSIPLLLTITPSANISFTAMPNYREVSTSSSTTYSLGVNFQNGFNSAVTFATGTMPSGVSASFSPSSLSATGTTTMTLSTTNHASAGTYTISVTASGGGTSQALSVTLQVGTTADYALVVSPASQTILRGANATYTLTAPGVNTFAGTVGGFSVSGLGTATASFSPTSITGSGSSTLTIANTASLQPGTYAVTVSSSSGSLTRTANLMLEVTDFAIESEPTQKPTSAGAATTFLVYLNTSGNFSAPVSFSTSGLSGFTSSWSNPTMSAAGTNTLTITPPTGQAAGSYPFTIQASNGSVTRTLSTSLVVTSNPDFWLTTMPRTLSIGQNFYSVFTIGVTGFNGFNQPVSFSVTGLPAGASYTMPSASAGGSTTLTISGATTGTYPLTISGTSGSLTRTVAATLVVNNSDFTLSMAPTTNSVVDGTGGGTVYTATIGGTNGFTGIVDLAVSGMPPGSTFSLTPSSIGGPGTASLVLYTDRSQTPTQDYTLTVTGTSSPVVHSATSTLKVIDYSMSATPSSVTVKHGNTVTSAVSVVPINTTSIAVFLEALNVPSGLTVTFSPQSLTSGATSTMSIKAANNLAPGTYTFSLDGNNFDQDRLQTITVTVTN
jgi:hypothetical protein